MPSLWAAGSAFILFTACIISGENQTKQANKDDLVAQESTDNKDEKKEDKLTQILPHVTFDCGGRTEGYYADIQFDCEVFHYCKPNGERFTFVCPPKSRFNQKHMICDYDRYGMKLCHTAEKYFKLNENLYPKTEDEKNANLNSTPRVEEAQQNKPSKPVEETKSEKPESKIKLPFQPRNRENKFKKTFIVTEYYNKQDLSTTQAPVIDDASPTVYKWYTPPVLSKDRDKYKHKYKYSDYYPDYYIDEDNTEDESSENHDSESEEHEQNEDEYNTESENKDKTVTTSKYSEENHDKDEKETLKEEPESHNKNIHNNQEENTKTIKEEPQNLRTYDQNIEYNQSPQSAKHEPSQDEYEDDNYQDHYEQKDNTQNLTPVKSYKKNQKTKRPQYVYRNHHNKQNSEDVSRPTIYIQDKYNDHENNKEVDQYVHVPEKEQEYNDYHKSHDDRNPDRYDGRYSDNKKPIQSSYDSRNEKQIIPERIQQKSHVQIENPIVEHTTDPTDGGTVKTTTFFHRYTKKSEQPPQTILYEKVSASTDSPQQVEYEQLPRQQNYQKHYDDNAQVYIEEQEPEQYEDENKETRRPVKIKLYVKGKPQEQQKEYYEEESDSDYNDKSRIQKSHPVDEVHYKVRQEENLPVREEIVYNSDQRSQPVEYEDYDQEDESQNDQNVPYEREQVREPYVKDLNEYRPNEEVEYRERKRPVDKPARQRQIYIQSQRSRTTESPAYQYHREVPTSNNKNVKPNDQQNAQYVYYNEARGQYRYTPSGKVSSYQEKRLKNGKDVTHESPNSNSNAKKYTVNPTSQQRQYNQNRPRYQERKSEYNRPHSTPEQSKSTERRRNRDAPNQQQTYIDRFKFRSIPEQSRTLYQEKFTKHVKDQPKESYESTPTYNRKAQHDETTHGNEQRQQDNPHHHTEPKNPQTKKYKIVTRRQKRQVASRLPLSQQFQQLLNKLYSPLESTSRNELNNFRNFISNTVPVASASSSRNQNDFRNNVSPYHVYPPSAYSYANADVPQNRPFHNRAPIYSEPSYNLSPNHYYRPHELPPIPPPNDYYYSAGNENRSNDYPSSLESTEFEDKPSSDVNDNSSPPSQSINHSDEQRDDIKRPEDSYNSPDNQKLPELHEFPFFNPDFPYNQGGNSSERNPQNVDFPYLRTQGDNYQIPDLGVYFDPYGELGVTPLYDTTNRPNNKDHSTASPENEEHRNTNSENRPENQEYSNNNVNQNRERGNDQSGVQYHVTPPSYLQRNRYTTPPVLSLFVTPPPYVRNNRVPPIYGEDFFNPPIRYPFEPSAITTTESPSTDDTTERYITQQDNSLTTPEPTTQIPEIPVTRASKRPYRRRQKVPTEPKNQQELVTPLRTSSRPRPAPDRSASRFRPEPTIPPVRQQQPPVRHQPPTVRHQPPPERHQPPPVRHQPPPERHQPPPVRQQSPPERHQPPPVRQQPPPERHQPSPVRTSAKPKPTAPPPKTPPSNSKESDDDDVNPFRGSVPFGTRLRRPPSSTQKRNSESNERNPSASNVSRRKRVHQSAASDRSVAILQESRDRVSRQNVQSIERPPQPRRASHRFKTTNKPIITTSSIPIIISENPTQQSDPFIYTNVQRYAEDQQLPVRPPILREDSRSNSRFVPNNQENKNRKRIKPIRRRLRVHHPRRGYQETTEFSTESTTTTTELLTTPLITPSTTITEAIVTSTTQQEVSENPTEIPKKRVYTSRHGGSLRNENVINRLKTKPRLFTFGRPTSDLS
ncbi:uncharacterized protein LOC111630709 [Centruroides sculpturatus]|uniref:uncharacterized protein LOC111630709 n=1 Tax=Centruroides sculpturatus TaxID=218467 RepID=UPI000C6D038E|nr:uncharacterized protein LOC111630709 [Centruroides sculpturatus]